MEYHVTADIEYLDGTLRGMVIPAGYSVTLPDERHAQRVVAHLSKVMRSDDFVRAVSTGNRYKVRGGIHSAKLMPLLFV